MDIFKKFMTYEFNKEFREIQDRIERMNENIEWLAANREKEIKKVVEQPVVLPELDTPELTPDQIKEQFALRGEEFLDETIAQLGKLQPSQLYENQTKKLPSPPPPKNHEEMLRLVKKDYSIDIILLRFQGQ